MTEPTRTIKIYEKTHPKLKILAATTGETIMELIHRLVLEEQEIKSMTTQTKSITISTGTYTLDQLAKLVASASQRGEWYDGPNSTNISDWLAEGDIDGTETIESLAAEWDK